MSLSHYLDNKISSLRCHEPELVLNSSFSDEADIITSYCSHYEGIEAREAGTRACDYVHNYLTNGWALCSTGPGVSRVSTVTTHNTGASVECRDNSGGSGIFICHIMFQLRWLFDLPERANWFIWPTPLSGAVFTQCAVYSNSPDPAHCDSVTGCCQSRGGSQTVMSACHNDNMTASWPTCHASDGPEIGSDCEQICRVTTRRLAAPLCPCCQKYHCSESVKWT